MNPVNSFVPTVFCVRHGI